MTVVLASLAGLNDGGGFGPMEELILEKIRADIAKLKQDNHEL